MNIGIAGYGVVGKTRHASILKNTDHQITAVSENNKDSHPSIPANIEIFEDYKSLIEKADIDIIFISLPNQFAADATSPFHSINSHWLLQTSSYTACLYCFFCIQLNQSHQQ